MTGPDHNTWRTKTSGWLLAPTLTERPGIRVPELAKVTGMRLFGGLVRVTVNPDSFERPGTRLGWSVNPGLWLQIESGRDRFENSNTIFYHEVDDRQAFFGAGLVLSF